MDVLDELIACCEAWEPDVCVLGNVRAGDAAQALRRLRAELEECIAALEKIANPISAMKRALPVGATLNGAMATTLSNDPNYLKEIAKAALAARKGEGEK